MNIFYTQVDANLQKELNARSKTGMNRDTNSLNFMLGKFANVQLSAYDGPGPAVDDSKLIHVLGGKTQWGKHYNAGGRDGFINANRLVIRPGDELEWDWDPSTKTVAAKESFIKVPNPQRRIPPYISSADIQIGDNSMGLLNTANIVIEIPNAERDLNLMENIYMRPGRYVKLMFIHDPKTIVSANETEGLLAGGIPSDAKLTELYPGVDLNAKKTEIRKMNQVVFEGLLTNFDFSYQKDFSVQLQIQLRGTSNVFTDVSMFIDAQGNTPGNVTINPIADPDNYKATLNISDNPISNKSGLLYNPFTNKNNGINIKPVTPTNNIASNRKFYIPPNSNKLLNLPPRLAFYQQLYNDVEYDYKISLAKMQQQPINPNISSLNTTSYTSTIAPTPLAVSPGFTQNQINRFDKRTGTIHTDQYFLFGNAWDQTSLVTTSNQTSTFQRYITLGYLINFININVLREVKGGRSVGKITENAQIVCSDKFCYSNYYPNLCSIDPTNILLLPADTKRNTTEVYGNKTFFKNTLSVDNTWEGFSGNLQEKTNRMFPSRILINLDLINEIIQTLSAGNPTAFKVSDFLAEISVKILNATSGAISLKLITHPEDQTVLAFYDENFIGTPQDKNGVREYTIPMSTAGTVVHDFQLKASLPDNVSSLSYVLNQDPERITTEDIGPYINYMYNSDDPTKVTAAQELHAKLHNEFKDKLQLAKIQFGESISDTNLQEALDLAQKNYLARPTPNLKEDIQKIAPIIPFDITFTIDGIHGFRYGDVLTFDVLPKKYKINTVFSIVGVNHQISQDSTWTTEIRCIMRPKVDG